MPVIKELIGEATLCIRGYDGTMYKLHVRQGEKPYTKRLTVAKLDKYYSEVEPYLVDETYNGDTKHPGAQVLESFLYWACHIEDKW